MDKNHKNRNVPMDFSTAQCPRCEIFAFFSSRSLKTREKYISFAQSVYFLRKVCLLFNFIIQKLKSKHISLKKSSNWAKLNEQNYYIFLSFWGNERRKNPKYFTPLTLASETEDVEEVLFKKLKVFKFTHQFFHPTFSWVTH